jgi:hypothetical protein
VSAQQEVIIAMERKFPRWQIWVVPRVDGGTLWCGRKWDDEKQVLNAGSPGELEQALETAE